MGLVENFLYTFHTLSPNALYTVWIMTSSGVDSLREDCWCISISQRSVTHHTKPWPTYPGHQPSIVLRNCRQDEWLQDLFRKNKKGEEGRPWALLEKLSLYSKSPNLRDWFPRAIRALKFKNYVSPLCVACEVAGYCTASGCWIVWH